MISLKDKRIVDLSWPIKSRLTHLDGTIEQGTRDVYDMPWIVEETVNQKDNTIEHLVGGNVRTIPDWPIAGTSGHMGSHIQLGVGHNDNWSDLPDGMLGIWDMPLDTYYGEACVCRLSHLKGEPILPTHLSNVRMGEHRAIDQPLRRRRPACGDRRNSSVAGRGNADKNVWPGRTRHLLGNEHERARTLQ